MLKKILGTIGTRYLIAILSLALIFINAKVLGLEGVGLVGLILASVNIAVIFNSILAGNTLVYFMNRYNMTVLIAPAYIWTVIGSGISCGIMSATGLLPEGYGLHIYFLSVISTLVSANARFLLGKDDIKGFNGVQFMQSGLLFFVLITLYFLLEMQDVQAYVTGMYVTYLIALITSIVLLVPYYRQEAANPLQSDKTISAIVREMFAYGLWAGTDNVAEVLTTRLNYFLLQRFGGLGSVGLLDAGTRISESVWHISRSVSFINYSEVARTEEKEIQSQITLRLFKLNFVALTLVMICILCIPEWVFTRYLFSEEFIGIRNIILGISVGIIAFGCNNVLAHYFIGTGRVKITALCSCLGLITLLIAGYFLIPSYDALGAALSCSIAYCVMLIFTLIVFGRVTHSRFVDFFPNRSDWRYIKEHLHSKLGR